MKALSPIRSAFTVLVVVVSADPWWGVAPIVQADQKSAATSDAARESAGGNDLGDDRYTPIPGGWQIRLRADAFYQDIQQKNSAVERDGRRVQAIDPATKRLTADAPVGLLLDNPRLHWRPLFPPADKSLIWTDQEQTRSPRVSFRPLVLAGTVPRFLFDYHSAGGLLGHLRLGLSGPGGGKWLHDWSDITVRYVDGRLEYELRDEAFPGTSVHVVASALAKAVGLIVKVAISGGPPDAALVWAYGGASAFYTNYNSNSPAFIYAAPQCARNDYTLAGNAFELVRGFDKSDAIVSGEGQGVGVMRDLPEWKARILGGSSWPAGIGFGSADAFTRSPDELLGTADFDAKSKSGCVALQKIPLDAGRTEGLLLVGMGLDMAGSIDQPTRAWEAAMERNASIARRIVTHTPDPYLDAAMTTLAFGNEGLWASQAFVHGGWSWRNAYLGWRILYGPSVYGWTDRVRKNILNHCRLCVIREGDDAGGISDMLERVGLYYNMDEVFFDMVRHYFDYTDDVELMKEIFPILEGAIERENRRLRPAGGALYESALNTWISDSHWYIDAQCTQASAYMLRAYEFMADVAPRVGRDDKPFREQAGKIREAMQSTLWQKRLGVFAECLDTRGNRLLHGEPELPTIYHSAEFGPADPLQVYQMLHWADTHLRQERTPGGGRLYWSSNWFPNHGQSYTHSTYEMAYGEELNFAETNFLAGRSGVGYEILRACLSGIFNGPAPGGLSCHAYVDGMQRANWEFADSISMWGRAVVEGLFGIRMNRPRQVVELTPQTPADWPEATIETPHFAYRIRRSHGQVGIDWTSPVETAVKLRLPLATAHRPKVTIDGRQTPSRLGKGVGLTWVEVDIPKGAKGTVEVDYQPTQTKEPAKLAVKQGEPLRLTLPDASIAEYSDPQGLLADARIDAGTLVGKVETEPGPGLIFVFDGNQEAPCWRAVAADVQPVKPIEKPKWSPPDAGERNLDRWTLIDLSKVFNASVPEVPKRVIDGAIPPPLPASQVGFGYWKEHVIVRCKPPCDTAWRAKVGPDGVAWTTDGIPFKTSKEGNNIAVACLHTKAFPAAVSLPVKAAGRMLYLMISGETWPAQSHVVNLRVTLRYSDGTSATRDLVQPFDIGNCWGEWCGLYHDTPANGFENIGGRSGPMGSSQVADLTKPIAVDTSAHLVRYDLAPGKLLDRVDMEVIANDVIFGIMGASIVR